MKKQKGISLIVLIITIIVIIILATAVVVTIVANNPIEEANKARYESDRDNMQAVFTNTVAKVMAENQGNVEVIAGQMNNQTTGVDKTTGEVNYQVENATDSSNTNGTIIFDKGINGTTKFYTGIKLPIYKSGETKWYVDKDGVISVEVNGVKYGKGDINNVLIAGEKATQRKNKFVDSEGNSAIIPVDFIVVPGCETISKGLVISDDINDTEINKQEGGSKIIANGNQFVWVPVNDMSTFVREDGYSNGNLQNRVQDCSEPLNFNGIIASQEEIKMYYNMLASVKKYAGFYMGRYEASNDGREKVQSKKNQIPWNLSWSNDKTMNILTGGAVEKAREMYKEGEAIKGQAISLLPYGVQWDETVRFIKKNYPDIEKDSSKYGHYGDNNSKKIQTGSNENYQLNHIYDMAGNVREWTMEAYYDIYRVSRGGHFNFTGTSRPISYRYNHEPTYNSSTENIGFRVMLYISL